MGWYSCQYSNVDFAEAFPFCRGNCPGKTWAEKSGTFAAARITSWAMFNRVSILVFAGPFAAAKVLLPRQIAICRGNSKSMHGT